MKPLERALPSENGVDARGLAELYQELSGLDCHSVMVTRHNRVIAEGYWNPYRSGCNHILYSVSKSFAGTAVGLAVGEGLLTVEDLVIDILDDILPSKPCPNMCRMKVRDLLTMCTGLKDERNVFHEGESWTYSLLSAYIDEEPGREFRYISSSTYLLSAIIWKLTGQTLYDYLKPRLFEPMGFSENLWWETSKEEMNTAFNGLNATAEDVTKLALLYLNHGRWEGRQLLPEKWVNEASAVQIDNSDNDKNQELGYRQGFGYFSEDWRSGYGYLFWHCSQEGAYRGDGIFGQMCIILPKQDMTIAVAAGCREPDKILKAIWKHLIPAVDSPDCCIGYDKELKLLLDHLTLPIPQGERHGEEEKRYSGNLYHMASNGLGILTLSVDFTSERVPFLTLTTDKGIWKAPVGYGEWMEAKTGYDPQGFSCDNVNFFDDAACSGAWQGREFVIRLVFTRTPFVDTLRLTFDGNLLTGTYHHTVKYGAQSHELMGFRK